MQIQKFFDTHCDGYQGICDRLAQPKTCEPMPWINNSLTLEQWIVKSPYVANID